MVLPYQPGGTAARGTHIVLFCGIYSGTECVIILTERMPTAAALADKPLIESKVKLAELIPCPTSHALFLKIFENRCDDDQEKIAEVPLTAVL